MKKMIFFLIIFLLMVSACDDDDDSETESASPTAPAASVTEEPVATEDVSDVEPTEEAEATEETSAGDTALVIGDISGNPADSLEEFQPLADYLEANLESVSEVSVKVASDMETMIDWMQSGEVDFYMDSLYPALIISDQANAAPILRRWKDEVDQYHAVIFVLKDSGLTSLSDLNGRTVAFDEEVSTSGYMLPLWLLLEADVTVVEKSSPTAPVGDEEVGYIFSGDDENTIQWVISGRVDAGAIDNFTFSEIPPETQEQLVILAESEDIPRQVAIVAGDMDPELVSALITILTGMDEDPAAEEPLDKLDTAQFDEFPEGAEAAITRMREIYEAVQAAQSE